MNKIDWTLDNIKCGGCGRTIEKKLLKYDGITEVRVIPEEDRVEFTAADAVDLETVQRSLSALGYPPAGTSSGMQTARSYVSCAIGRMNS